VVVVVVMRQLCVYVVLILFFSVHWRSQKKCFGDGPIGLKKWGILLPFLPFLSPFSSLLFPISSPCPPLRSILLQMQLVGGIWSILAL